MDENGFRKILNNHYDKNSTDNLEKFSKLVERITDKKISKNQDIIIETLEFHYRNQSLLFKNAKRDTRQIKKEILHLRA